MHSVFMFFIFRFNRIFLIYLSASIKIIFMPVYLVFLNQAYHFMAVLVLCKNFILDFILSSSSFIVIAVVWFEPRIYAARVTRVLS